MLNSYMALILDGPMQSWGVDSQFNYRKTGLMPTKSAIAGMCCAAFGYNRGSDDEKKILQQFQKIKMLTISIPKECNGEKINVSRMRDYHTVAKTRKAKDGKIDKKNSQLTFRFYLQDAKFGVLLDGESAVLYEISKALNDPVWGISLGRKNCIPSVPVHINNEHIQMLFDSKEEALNFLLGEEPLVHYTHQFDVARFEDGDDSLPDLALSFGSFDSDKKYCPRRVKTIIGKEK